MFIPPSITLNVTISILFRAHKHMESCLDWCLYWCLDWISEGQLECWIVWDSTGEVRCAVSVAQYWDCSLWGRGGVASRERCGTWGEEGVACGKEGGMTCKKEWHMEMRGWHASREVESKKGDSSSRLGKEKNRWRKEGEKNRSKEEGGGGGGGSWKERERVHKQNFWWWIDYFIWPKNRLTSTSACRHKLNVKKRMEVQTSLVDHKELDDPLPFNIMNRNSI